jgi:uncharacterized protein YndB with AHSA1/START domain
MNGNKNITVETTVNAPIEKVWQCWNEPSHITQWAFASDDWEAPHAENDLREGGKSKIVMAAKDGSAKFDLIGTYTTVKEHELIEYYMEDGRTVNIRFESTPEGVKVTETFEMEGENSEELQRAGWSAILENFRKHVESH